MTKTKAETITVGDWVKCTGGTAALGEIGKVVKVTPKRVLLLLESKETKRKEKKYVKKVPAPPQDVDKENQPVTPPAVPDANDMPSSLDKANANDKPPAADSPNEKPQSLGNDNDTVIISIPDVQDAETKQWKSAITQDNKKTFMKVAFEELQKFGPIQGRCMVFRGFRQIIFKMSSSQVAAKIIAHYSNHGTLQVEGHECHIGYAERSTPFEEYKKKMEEKGSLASKFAYAPAGRPYGFKSGDRTQPRQGFRPLQDRLHNKSTSTQPRPGVRSCYDRREKSTQLPTKPPRSLYDRLNDKSTK
ncbi:expressed unknown protein [Seminavis robusta]|uniref:Uncharacterized protein n=1 Tax=Seminavis robusta TaxID=568900 RepID=A0A9N8EAJ4_9STRA|nr:expressed unknown protein [Seminavis robusta]|eukprot:Sro678_g185980.1 n/a (303) ;mRNA; f:41007-41915